MKKINLPGVILAFYMLASAGGCSGAFERPDEVRGTIIVLNQEKNEIVIEDSFTGKEKTVIASHQDMAVLLPGVRVKVKLKHASNIAEKIKIRQPVENQKNQNSQ